MGKLKIENHSWLSHIHLWQVFAFAYIKPVHASDSSVVILSYFSSNIQLKQYFSDFDFRVVSCLSSKNQSPLKNTSFKPKFVSEINLKTLILIINDKIMIRFYRNERFRVFILRLFNHATFYFYIAF